MKISFKNYCESWRMNVELHNIREFQVVPEECVGYIGNYVTSTQYKVDCERAIEESIVYLSTGCNLKNDGRDAWIFDIDDTLLSTVPYHQGHHFGREKLNLTALEEWMSHGKAPALKHSLKLFNEIARPCSLFDFPGNNTQRSHASQILTDQMFNMGATNTGGMMPLQQQQQQQHGSQGAFGNMGQNAQNLQSNMAALQGTPQNHPNVLQQRQQNQQQ